MFIFVCITQQPSGADGGIQIMSCGTRRCWQIASIKNKDGCSVRRILKRVDSQLRQVPHAVHLSDKADPSIKQQGLSQLIVPPPIPSLVRFMASGPLVVVAGAGKTFLVTGGTQGMGLVISAW